MATGVLERGTMSLVQRTPDRGWNVEQRRRRLGYKSIRQFQEAMQADGLTISRQTATRAEAGIASENSYAEIDRWLEEREAQAGIAALPALNGDGPVVPVPRPGDDGTVTFQLKGNFGVDVTVKGPVTNLAELEESIERLLEKMDRQEHPPPA